jgi:hypothetical protein
MAGKHCKITHAFGAAITHLLWCELLRLEQDYSAAVGDSNQKFLASQGITLSNYWAITHPSEPNYCAAAAGENFGMGNDDFNAIHANASTIADLLDTRGISWAEYQEHMQYPGFQGFSFSSQEMYGNDYVRKHDPLILLDSVTQNATRLQLIKNFTDFWNTDYIHAISNDAGRSMMGSRQRNWFYDTLKASKARGATWRVIGSQTVFSRINESISYGNVNPLDYDARDGYQSNRNRTFNTLVTNNITNNIAISGDSHTNWMSASPGSAMPTMTPRRARAVLVPSSPVPPCPARAPTARTCRLCNLSTTAQHSSQTTRNYSGPGLLQRLLRDPRLAEAS